MEETRRRLIRATTLAALGGLAVTGLALAQEPDGTSLKKPTENGGNAIVNGGEGSGTGTSTPGPGMTIKDGRNPTPSANPVANGGNTDLNNGKGSGTGTVEPKGDK